MTKKNKTKNQTKKTKLEELKEELDSKKGHIKMLADSIKDKDNEIMILKAKLNSENLTTMKESLMSQAKNNHLNLLKWELIKKNDQLNKFRGSIIYPFYKITHKFGKTKIGGIIAKLLKWLKWKNQVPF